MGAKLSKQSFLKRSLFEILMAFFIFHYLVPGILFAQGKLYEDLFSVSFPNEKDGWACGRWGSILHTVDGGLTWVRQNTGTDYTLSRIFFVDAQNGWAVGEEGTIIHTTNGGRTWERQKSPISFFLMGVYFVTPLKGWIVTEQTHILSTNDGGKIWKKQFSAGDFILKAVSFCDSFHGWAVGEYGFIYHTSDAGSTWKRQAGSYGFSERGEVEGGIYLFDVIAIDPMRVWAAGIDGYVTRTEDGGRTWKPVITGAPKTQLFGCAHDKAGNIAIGGKGILLFSGDKGRTWLSPKMNPTIVYDYIYGLASRGSSGFVGVGREGAIYLNGSNTWNRVQY